MTAQQLNDALNALWPDLDRGTTVDRVITGDPSQVVRGVAVCWMPYSSALREAARHGANVVVTHEPTFFSHFELNRDPGDGPLHRAKADKQKLIDELGLTILRCHDVWDAIGEVGVPFEWGRFLALGEPSTSVRYMNVYDVPEQTAGQFARHVASRTATLGQPVVGFHGDMQTRVRRVGLGTGCYSDPHKLFDLGADLAISADDIVRAWIDGEWSHDTGRPVVVVNHGVTEEPAMRTLARQIEILVGPAVAVRHIPQGCSYRSIGAADD